MIARPCAESGCPAVATQRGRCDEHARPAESQRRHEHDRLRGSASQRGYGARWRRVREWKLKRQPTCADCEANGSVTLAIDVHHLDGDNTNNRDDNLLALCRGCHSRRTMMERQAKP